jgi:hypothetical protein
METRKEDAEKDPESRKKEQPRRPEVARLTVERLE